MARARDCDVAVVGGGMAGLMAARQLTVGPRGRTVILLESAPRLGGRVLSRQDGDAWVNLGAQFLAGPGPLWDVADELGVPYLPLDGFHPGLATARRVVPADQPLGMLASLDVSLRGRAGISRLGVRVLADYWRMALRRNRAAARAWRNKLEGLSASDRFLPSSQRHAAGPENAAGQVLRLLVRFWLGAEPEEAAAAHAAVYLGLSVVPQHRLPKFATPVGGNERLIDALAASRSYQVVTEAPVSLVRQDGDSVTVHYRQADQDLRLSAAGCIVATPADVAARITADLPLGLAAALGAVRYGTYVCVGVFLDQPAPDPFDRYYLVTPLARAFHVVTSPVIAQHRTGVGGPGSLLAYAGGEPARRLIRRSDEEITRIFLADLLRAWPSLTGHVTGAVVQRWPAAVPYWPPGGRQGHEVMRAGCGRIRFAGDYLGYPSMQVAAMNGISAAMAIERDVLPPETGDGSRDAGRMASAFGQEDAAASRPSPPPRHGDPEPRRNADERS